MVQLIWPAFPTLRSAQVLLVHVLFDQRPSLHNLRWRSPAFVRLLRRYYSAVRLPITVHVGLIAHRLLPPVRGLPPRTMTGPLGSRAWSFYACMGSSTPQGRGALALSHLALLRSGLQDAVRSLIRRFRSSIPSPHMPLSNASSAASRPPSHGSGPGWFAVPYPYDFCHHCSTPVYPDAIPAELLTHHTWALSRGFTLASYPARVLASYQVQPTTSLSGSFPHW